MENKSGKHALNLMDRSSLAIEGVQHVASFDEAEIILATTMGVLSIRGEGLHITQLNLELGKLVVEGHVGSLEYSDDRGVKGMKNRGKGILDRILR